MEKFYQIPVAKIAVGHAHEYVYVPVYSFDRATGAMSLMILPYEPQEEFYVEGIHYVSMHHLDSRGMYVLPASKIEELEELLVLSKDLSWYLFDALQASSVQHAEIMRAGKSVTMERYLEMYRSKEKGPATIAFDIDGNIIAVNEFGDQIKTEPARLTGYFLTGAVVAVD